MSEAAETLAVAKKLQPMLAELVTKVRAVATTRVATTTTTIHHHPPPSTRTPHPTR